MPAPLMYRDRAHAGEALARSLSRFAGASDVVVLGLARGGVQIARQVADAIAAPFSVLVSCTIGVPGIEEVALGAIAEGSAAVVTDAVAWYLGVPSIVVDRLAARERIELERRLSAYRDDAPLPDVQHGTVILVDDGLATSARLRAAARALRQRGPKRIIAAVPVASRLGMEELRGEVDEIVALTVPESFETIAAWYDCFTPSSDDDVLSALGRPTRRVSRMVHDVSGRVGDTERTIEIPVGDGQLVGDLGTSHHDGVHESGPSAKDGLVILAHGGGSTRDSYRNRYIAGRLRLSGYATLRVDLLTKHEQEMEAAGGALPFGVARIAARLTEVCDWAVRSGVSGARRTILMAGATGAAAALATAAQRQGNTFAVVVRGGRVDLTGPRLEQVRAPVLLIVGDADREVARVGTDAMRTLPRSSRLIRVPGAGDAFDEPGALGAAAEQTVRWLDRLMAKRTRTALGLRRSAV